MKHEIKLDTDSFKALSSDTRRKMLKKLGERRMTVTELSKALDISKSTVHEHLSRLNQAELVEKKDDEHKWVYYELTDKGSKILNPDTRTRILLFTTALITAASASLFQFYRSLSLSPVCDGAQPLAALEAERGMEAAAERGILETIVPENLLLGIFLALIAIYFLFQLKRSLN